MKRYPGRCSLLLLPIVIAIGCAAEPKILHWRAEEARIDAQVWPAAPDVARYRYVGQLTGEDNFASAERERPPVASRVLRWLVGLGRDRLVRRMLSRPQSGAVDTRARRVYVTDAGRRAVFVFDEGEGRLHIWDSADADQEFASPVGVALGPDGALLVSDAELARVVRLDGDGRAQSSFGAEELQRPTGLARDPLGGRVYVADTTAHDIKVFDDEGRLLDQIGRRGTGPGEFNAPTHLAFADGRLYVSDTLNARVQVLDAAGGFLGEIGERGRYVGNLARSKGVTVDPDGNVYVVESYHDHLLVFDAEGRFLMPIGGTGTTVGRFYLPAGAWSDASGRIFIADMYNGRVFVMQYLGV